VFRDRFYLGYTYWRAEGIEVRGNHPPLTDQDTFERVQAMLDERSGGQRGTPWHHEYLLRGLLWSVDDGCALYGETNGGKGISYYVARVDGRRRYIPCLVIDGQLPTLMGEVGLDTLGDLALPADQRHLTLALKVASDVGAVYAQLDTFAERRALLELVFGRIAVCGDRLVRAGTVLKEPFGWVRVNLAPLPGLDSSHPLINNGVVNHLNGLLGNGFPVPQGAISILGGVA
jgi:hypothetical protein